MSGRVLISFSICLRFLTDSMIEHTQDMNSTTTNIKCSFFAEAKLFHSINTANWNQVRGKRINRISQYFVFYGDKIEWEQQNDVIYHHQQRISIISLKPKTINPAEWKDTSFVCVWAFEACWVENGLSSSLFILATSIESWYRTQIEFVLHN